MLTRRKLLKSTIIGIGAITVPLVVRCYPSNFFEALKFDVAKSERWGRTREQIEDIMLDDYHSSFTPTRVVYKSNVNSEDWVIARGPEQVKHFNDLGWIPIKEKDLNAEGYALA